MCFVTTPQGGNGPILRQTFCMRSQSHEWSGLGSIPFFQFNSNSNSVIFNSNSNSNSTTHNKFQFQFQFQFQTFQFQFQFQFRRIKIQSQFLKWPLDVFLEIYYDYCCGHQIGLIYFIQYFQLVFLWNAFGRPTGVFHGRFTWYWNGILEFCICLVMTWFAVLIFI